MPAILRRCTGEAVELTAMLCREHNLDPLADGVVICHPGRAIVRGLPVTTGISFTGSLNSAKHG